MINLLPHIVRESAKTNPNGIAFKCGSTSLKYDELWNQVNQLSNFLIANGVEKGDRIGIYMNRSIETASAIYGIMKAGAVYVPLDPESPSNRNAFIVNDCDISIIITNKMQKKSLANLLTKEIDIKLIIGHETDGAIRSISWQKLLEQEVEFKPDVNKLESDLSYILYTSGSTGEPKGIMHSHASGLGYAKLSVHYYGITSYDVLANHAAINFDISTLGYFAGPLAAATTVIIQDAYIKMPASLVQLISKEKITIWYSVPSALSKIIDQESLKSLDFSSLRWILFAGEVFPTPHLRTLMNQWNHAKFSNIFGPTEVNGCTYLILDDAPETDEPISIGKPWDKTEIMIVDENNNLVENGETGELLVSTVTMMKGYWNHPEKTSQVFYSGIDKAGKKSIFYRTGDLVVERVDGNLTFIGRKDRQVKVNGYRIELDEISSVLIMNDSVSEVAVYLAKDAFEKDIIEASVILKQNVNATINLKAYCLENLPKYAVPESIQIKNEIPRTPRGKIDYQLLLNKDVEVGA